MKRKKKLSLEREKTHLTLPFPPPKLLSFFTAALALSLLPALAGMVFARALARGDERAAAAVPGLLYLTLAAVLFAAPPPPARPSSPSVGGGSPVFRLQQPQQQQRQNNTNSWLRRASAAVPVPLHPLRAVFPPESRHLFAATAARVALPTREVTWSDFLLADVATSLAAPIAGAAAALCHLLTAPSPLAPLAHDSKCAKGSLLLFAAAASPYAARFAQCLRVWRDTGNTGQLWNALKYFTAFPALWLAGACERERLVASFASGGGGGGHHSKDSSGGTTTLPTPGVCWGWVAAQLLNSCFSYYWDVERDWEVSWFSNRRSGGSGTGSGSNGGLVAGLVPPPIIKPSATLPRRYYLWLLASNAVARLAWLHRLHPATRAWSLAPAAAGALEAARRAQWVPARVEVELRKVLGVEVGGPGEQGQLLGTPRGGEHGGGRPLVGVGGEP